MAFPNGVWERGQNCKAKAPPRTTASPADRRGEAPSFVTRGKLARRLRALELAGDAQRTADMSARLDRALAGTDVVTEDDLFSRLRTRGLAQP